VTDISPSRISLRPIVVRHHCGSSRFAGGLQRGCGSFDVCIWNHRGWSISFVETLAGL